MNKGLTVGVIVLLGLSVILLFSNSFLHIVFKEKVWLHKVNSLEELQLAESKYSGVELDVVYNASKNYFDIHHPPELESGLTLEQYFKSVSSIGEIGFWIDFKNLDESNANQSIQRLIKISELAHIDASNIIVEAKNSCLLSRFSKAGFLTSYYLPTGMYNQGKANLQQTLTIIEKQVEACPSSYISSEFKDYEILKSNFPKKKKLFWFTVYAGMNKLKARIMLLKLLLDDSVEVLLISD